MKAAYFFKIPVSRPTLRFIFNYSEERLQIKHSQVILEAGHKQFSVGDTVTGSGVI